MRILIKEAKIRTMVEKSVKLMRNFKNDAKTSKKKQNPFLLQKIFKFSFKNQFKISNSLNFNWKFFNLTGHSVKSTKLILNHPRLNLNQFLTPPSPYSNKIFSTASQNKSNFLKNTPRNIAAAALAVASQKYDSHNSF